MSTLMDGRLNTFFEWQSPKKDPFFSRLAGEYVDSEIDYWRSFVVQEIAMEDEDALSKVKLILLDTTNYHASLVEAKYCISGWRSDRIKVVKDGQECSEPDREEKKQSASDQDFT